MTEAELKRAVLALAYRHGWLVYHHPATTVRGSQGKGYPDLTLARDGDVRFLELKQAQGRVQVNQWAWLAALGGDGTADSRARVIRPADLPSLEDWLR